MVSILLVVILVYIANIRTVTYNAILGRTDFVNIYSSIQFGSKKLIGFKYKNSTVNLISDFFFWGSNFFKIPLLSVEKIRYVFQLLLFQTFIYLFSVSYLKSEPVYYVFTSLLLFSPLKKYGWYMHVNFSNTPYNGLIALGICLNIFVFYLMGYPYVFVCLIPLLIFIHIVHSMLLFGLLFLLEVFDSGFTISLLYIIISFLVPFLFFVWRNKRIIQSNVSFKKQIFLENYLKLRANSIYVKSIVNNYKLILSPIVIYPILIVSTLFFKDPAYFPNEVKFIIIVAFCFIYVQYLLVDFLDIKAFKKIAISRGTSYAVIFFSGLLSKLIVVNQTLNSELSLSVLSVILYSMFIFSANIKHNILLIPYVLFAFSCYYNSLEGQFFSLTGFVLVYFKYSTLKTFTKNILISSVLSFLILYYNFAVEYLFVLFFLVFYGLDIFDKLKQEKVLKKVSHSWLEVQNYIETKFNRNHKVFVPLFPSGFNIHCSNEKTMDGEDSMYPVYTGVLYDEAKFIYDFLEIKESASLVEINFIQLFNQRWENLTLNKINKIKETFNIRLIIRRSNDKKIEGLNRIFQNDNFSIYKL
jgi:hypothetical protein